MMLNNQLLTALEAYRTDNHRSLKMRRATMQNKWQQPCAGSRFNNQQKALAILHIQKVLLDIEFGSA